MVESRNRATRTAAGLLHSWPPPTILRLSPTDGNTGVPVSRNRCEGMQPNSRMRYYSWQLVTPATPVRRPGRFSVVEDR